VYTVIIIILSALLLLSKKTDQNGGENRESGRAIGPDKERTVGFFVVIRSPTHRRLTQTIPVTGRVQR
jgi:hypothetical protein